jgi:hypothetical protein
MQEINITYIGRHARLKDVLYGTGEWEQGQVKAVPQDTATKMLKHTDAYVVSTVTEPAEAVVIELPEKADESNAVQEAIDAIQTMNVDGVKTFVENNFGQKLDGRKSVEKLRAEAQHLIHQYGIPG